MAYGNYAPFYRGGYFNPMQTQPITPLADNQNQFAQQFQPTQNAVNPLQVQPSNEMIFVLNQNEADSYPVAPNCSVVLWDRNRKTFYIKTANAQGVPSIQIYDFAERTETAEIESKTHECGCGDKFVTKEQFDDLSGKFEHLTQQFDDLSSKVESSVSKPKTTTKKSKGDEE